MKKTHGNWTTIDQPAGYLDDIDHDLKYHRKNNKLPSDKINISNSCNIPLATINIDHKGRVFLCSCDGWLPFSIGHVTDFSSIDEIYANSISKTIIESVTNKKYTFCATKICGIENTIKSKNVSILDMYVGIDISCNYSCPSCRERIIFDQSTEYINQRINWANSIIKLIKSDPSRNIQVIIGSNGEPFVSKIYLHLINELKKLDNIFFVINTNSSSVIDNKNILDESFFKKTTQFSVSIDAAYKSTYEILRRPGKWENLIENLKYIKSFNIPIRANFVVQKSNFTEMSAFVDFCTEYRMEPSFSLMTDWGSYHNFTEQIVHIPESPHYQEFREVLSRLPKNLVKHLG